MFKNMVIFNKEKGLNINEVIYFGLYVALLRLNKMFNDDERLNLYRT